MAVSSPIPISISIPVPVPIKFHSRYSSRVPGSGDAIHDRHRDVGQDQIWFESYEDLHGLITNFSFFDSNSDSTFLERHDEDFSTDLVIVHDKDLQRRGAG